MTHPRPHSLTSERITLGFALVHPEWTGVLDGLVDDSDYYDVRHRWYHSAIVDLGMEFTFERMRHWMKERGAEEYFDQSYISKLHDEWWQPEGDSTARKSASDVHRYAKLRSLIDITARVSAEAGQKGWRPDGEWLSRVEAKVLGAIRDAREQDHVISLSEQVPLCIERAEEIGKTEETPELVKTGFGDIDKIIGGMRPGDLVIVAGRPSMGKTSLARACAWGRGRRDKPVLFFTAETDAADLTDGMLSAMAKVDGHCITNGELTEDHWGRLIEAATELVDGTPMLMIDCADWRIGRLCSEARTVSALQGVSLIVVDYIQLLSGDNTGRFTNREREVASISKGLKALAKELKVPVIAVSQLNRGLEKRDDKRPRLSDLRESGAIEQDADKVLLVYRDEVYNANTSNPGIAEVNVAKNRKGRIGRAFLRWTAEFTRFDDFTEVDPFDGVGKEGPYR